MTQLLLEQFIASDYVGYLAPAGLIEGLLQMLKSLDMPVAYGQFTQTTSPPFITYQFSNNDDLIADNQNYVSVETFQVELYTDKKDITTERLLQDKFKEFRLPYSKSETWIESEKMWQVVYEIQLIGG